MSKSEGIDWSRAYSDHQMAYPSEYVIRIFKGNYPRLNFDKTSYSGKNVCDVGCGDGRNIAMMHSLGLKCFGVEIHEDIVETCTSNLNRSGINDADIRVGNNAHIPFASCSFDYLLSWNACYYMGGCTDFSAHIDEFSRVLKDDGYLILSIPMQSCFIYDGCDIVEGTDRGRYAIIRNDPFMIRNGVTLKIFRSDDEIVETFSSRFHAFTLASIYDDCFGLNYHWHLVICQKKGRSACV